jgi:transposase InsO family protein
LESTIGSKFWLIILDDCSDYVWSYYLKQKSESKTKVMELIKWLKSRGTPVSYIRGDNSGENNSLHKSLKQQGLNIKFEYTAPGNLQQDGCVEQKFAIIYEYVKSIKSSQSSRIP